MVFICIISSKRVNYFEWKIWNRLDKKYNEKDIQKFYNNYPELKKLLELRESGNITKQKEVALLGQHHLRCVNIAALCMSRACEIGNYRLAEEYKKDADYNNEKYHQYHKELFGNE
jgi:hypothetical protein